MFREMMINFDNRPVTKQETKEILKNEPRGILAVLGDDDYPYCMPLDYWYSEEENRIYFHSGIKGHKVDAIKKHEKVCFCICNEGYREDGDWSLNIISIIAFGKVVIIDDYEKAMDICRQLSYKFTGDDDYIEGEIEELGHETLVFGIDIEHMTAKFVNES